MINPAKLFKMKKAWDTFELNHPKFPKFLKEVSKNAIEEGTLIEISVTTPEGKNISSNIKVTQSDKEMFSELSDILKDN